MTGPEPALTIDSPQQLKALGHPLRLKVLQALGSADGPLTNRNLAERLAVDPGHLHFHVRMLHRAGLIERAEGGAGREKPYRLVAQHMKVGPAVRAAGLATDLQAAQLHELGRGFERHAARGEFRTTQVHVKLDADTLQALIDDLVDRLSEAEDDRLPSYSITIGFHPSIDQGEADST